MTFGFRSEKRKIGFGTNQRLSRIYAVFGLPAGEEKGREFVKSTLDALFHHTLS
jgi:hypothetical protein